MKYFYLFMLNLSVFLSLKAQPPEAYFIANTTSGCTGMQIYFYDLSTGDPTQWHWIFEGGNPSESFEPYPTVIYDTPGSYSVTLIVSNNQGSNQLTMENYITIQQSLIPSITISPSANPACQGEQITFTAQYQNAGDYPTFSWFVNNIEIGEYEPVYVSSNLNNGDIITCQLTASEYCAMPNPVLSNEIVMNVNQLVPITVQIFADNEYVCPGTSIHFWAITENAGNNPSYLWLKNGEDLGVNSADLYLADFSDGDIISCYVTSYEQCVTNNPAYSNELIVNVYPLPQFIISHNDVLCFGDANGSAEIIIDDPLQYLYNWSNGETSHSISNLSEGTYYVTVTNSYNCTVQGSVFISQPDIISVEFYVTNASTGMSNGAITAQISGGTPDYYIMWLPVNIENSQTISNLTPGQYTISITDANGCTKVEDVWVYEEGCNMLYAIDSLKNVSCYGLSDGYVLINAINGQEPYTYQWSNGYSINILENASAGTYYFTITDITGCEITDSIIITQPEQLQYSFDIIPAGCGSANGSATVNVIGGSPPYYYEWNSEPPQYSQTADNLSSGLYYLTISDFNGCIEIVQVEVPDSSNLDITFQNIQHVTCSQWCNGEVTINITGGSEPYNIFWSNGQTGLTATNLCTQTYYVTVIDAGNCSRVREIEINDDNIFSATVSVNDVTCYNLCNGSIVISPNGGIEPITYEWSIPNEYNSYINNQCAGEYSYTVTDAIGCTLSNTVTISQPDQININLIVDQPFCGQNNGSITAIVNGGTQPYNFIWNTTPPLYTATITNLYAGIYTLTVTDANNCVKDTTIILSESSSQLIVTIDSLKNVSCYGYNDGYVMLTVTGGTEPYSYQWLPTDIDLENLTAGVYYYTITDALGCSVSDSIQITQPSEMSLLITTQDATCGLSNGGATVVVSGGTPGYTYFWNTEPPQTTQTATGLSQGVYTVTVTDSNGCTKSISATVVTNGGIIVSIDSLKHVSCYGYSDGYVSFEIIGGTPPYSYQWIPSDANPSNLIAGNYSYTITDVTGCSASGSFQITEPSAMSLLVTIQDATCGLSNGSATVMVSGGTPEYTYLWNTVPPQTTQAATGLSQGSYIVTVTDNNGCTATSSAIIQSTAGFNLIIDTIASVSCYGYSDGMISIYATGGTPPYNYQWSNGQNGSNIAGLTAGIYIVTVTDFNDCSTTQTYIITSPQQMNVNYSLNYTNCTATSNVLINITTTGGTPPYSYIWSTGSTSEDITVTQTGTYFVTVIDSKNCPPIVQQITVQQASNITVSSTKIDASCKGQCNGNINITPTGGISPYGYYWKGPNGFVSTDEDIYNLCAGWYYVTITDMRGCSIQRSFSIGEPPLLNASFNLVSNPTCHGLCDGKIKVTASGGTPSYTYSWDGISCPCYGNYIINICAGVYTVTITDAKGCTKVLQTELIEPMGFPLSVNSSNVTCYGYNNGSINLNVDTTFSLPVSFAWVGPNNFSSTSEDIYNLIAGYYTVVVTSGNYCSAITINITQPSKLDVSFIVKNETFAGAADGQIIANISGGTQPYSINWSNGQTNDTISGLSAGSYTITVTDANGCSIIKSVKVNTGIGIKENSTELCFKILNNPLENLIIIESRNCVKDVELIDLTGRIIRKNNGNENFIFINTSNINKGIYNLKIYTDNDVFVYKLITGK